MLWWREMKRVAILMAPGFEEAEAIITIDILRRLELSVDVLSCTDKVNVMSYHRVSIVADDLLSNNLNVLYDAIVLPGGPNGSSFLSQSSPVLDFIMHHDDNDKLICAICSAAARVLGGNGLLMNRKYVCSGNLWENIEGGVFVDKDIVMDGNLLSGKGLGKAFDFAFHIAALLLEDPPLVEEQAEHIYYPWFC